MSKIAVAGKGGSGKTTVAGVLARLWAEQGVDVLTVVQVRKFDHFNPG